MMAAILPSRQPLLPTLPLRRRITHLPHVLTVRSFQRSDFDRFARNAWRSANEGFELFLYEARKAAERIDRTYSVSRRLSSAAQSAADRAREIDRELSIGVRWRVFSMDFRRNWPRYKRQLDDFLDSPVGRGFATLFFIWFAFSGWLFRFLIFATWVLPFAAPLLIGTVANNLVIKGACPACKRQFVGYKNQVIRCAGCRNIVWQPESSSGTGRGRGTSSSKSDPDIIDVEFEEK